MKTQITNLDAWHLVVLGMFEIYYPGDPKRSTVLSLGSAFPNAIKELKEAGLIGAAEEITDKGRELLQHLKGSFRMSSAMHAGFPPRVTHPTERDQELQAQRFVSDRRPTSGWHPDLEHMLGFIITARHEGTASYQHIDLVPKGIANIRERMIAKDLVVVGAVGQPQLTPRGKYYLRMLLRTPLPVETSAFIDPRMLEEPES